MPTTRYKVSMLEQDGVDTTGPEELDFNSANIYMDPAGFATDNTKDNIIEAKGGRKAGVVPAVSFTGNPKIYAIVFLNAYVDASYSIDISGVDSRSWSYSNKTATGFTINSNANLVLTGEVSWKTIRTGE